MHHEPVETVTYKGYKIHVHFDEDAQNPRIEWDNASHMLCFHRRYNLGDKKDSLPNINHSDYNGWEEMKAALEKEHGAVEISPLYLLDHSGISISMSDFHDSWDSGCVGFIYMTRRDILESFGGKILTKARRQKARECMQSEVNTYDQYLRNEVYGYIIEGPDGEDTEDSVWGYFGETKDMIEEAKHAIDYRVRKAEEKAADIQRQAESYTGA